MVHRSLSSSFVGLIVALGAGQALGAGTSSLRAAGALLLFAREVRGFNLQTTLRHSFDFRGHIGDTVVDSVGGVRATIATGMERSGVGLVFASNTAAEHHVAMSYGPAPGRGIDISNPGDAGGVSIEILIKVSDFDVTSPIFTCGEGHLKNEFVLTTLTSGMFQTKVLPSQDVERSASDKGATRSTEQWYHIVVTLGGGAGTLYVDGVAYAFNPGPAPLPLVDRQCFLGKGFPGEGLADAATPPSGGSGAFRGEIGFLRIHTGVMSVDSVSSALASALPVRVPLHLFDFRGDIFSYGAAPTTRVFHDAYNRDVRASIVGAGSTTAADRPTFTTGGVRLSASVASYIEFTNVAGAAGGLNDIGGDGQEGARARVFVLFVAQYYSMLFSFISFVVCSLLFAHLLPCLKRRDIYRGRRHVGQSHEWDERSLQLRHRSRRCYIRHGHPRARRHRRGADFHSYRGERHVHRDV